jgi:hypothetical protein
MYSTHWSMSLSIMPQQRAETVTRPAVSVFIAWM